MVWEKAAMGGTMVIKFEDLVGRALQRGRAGSLTRRIHSGLPPSSARTLCLRSDPLSLI